MQSQSHNPDVILASSSVYRKLLLERLNLDFDVLSPDIDESPLDQETPEHLVVRLAQEKARAVAEQFPAALVIGSDQVAVFETNMIGKPGTDDAAVRQLRRFSGNCVQFLTAVRLCCADSGFDAGSMILTEVIFRQLSEQEIQRYDANHSLPLGYGPMGRGTKPITCTSLINYEYRRRKTTT